MFGVIISALLGILIMILTHWNGRIIAKEVEIKFAEGLCDHSGHNFCRKCGARMRDFAQSWNEMIESDPKLCVHGNECPHICTCPTNCYCKVHGSCHEKAKG
jgi:hypothetical protein